MPILAPPVVHISKVTRQKSIKHVVFFDGTGNRERSYTNVFKLRNLITLQSREDIRTSYISGVGAGYRSIGKVTGWGIGLDVQEAYRFLLDNYQKERGDEIFVFRFSRGAYAARMLAAMLFVCGLDNNREMKGNEKRQFVKSLFSAFKTLENFGERLRRVEAALGASTKPVAVEYMGLWETVEALGLPDYSEDTVNPNPRYADQLCNVNAAAHALSIDDNRARIFTPLLLHYDHFFDHCKASDTNKSVEGVWFSGAHSDVGGGNANTSISGVSLNWMLKKIEEYKLLPPNTRVYQDSLGATNNPHRGLFKLVYKEVNRSLGRYYDSRQIRIHRSVVDRLSVKKPEAWEFQWQDSPRFSGCFQSTEQGYELVATKDRIVIVD